MICEKIPVFDLVLSDGRGASGTHPGQLYVSTTQWGRETLWYFAGWSPGCGREIDGERCYFCLPFLPVATDRGTHKVGRKPSGRKVVDGKAAAAGPDA